MTIPDTKDFSSLDPVVQSMAGTSILVVGDIVLDRFVYGEATRISPESPVPILNIKRDTLSMGGAGNVLANLDGLGVRTNIVAVVGNDQEANTLRDLVRDANADPALLIATSDRPTTVKTRFLSGHQQLLRTDHERAAPVVENIEAQILEKALQEIAKVDAVILSDYGKGVLTKQVISSIIKAAGEKGIPVLVDPKGRDYSIYKGADVVTPNRKELAEATSMPTESDDDITSAATALMTSSGIKSVVATRSQDGMTIIHQGTIVHLPTHALEVFDVSGAGDTVIATIAAAIATGTDLFSAATIANVAAGIVVGKVGTAAIQKDELIAALDQADRLEFSAPLLSWDAAREQVARWRAKGLRIGFTNGCFDILHSGHVMYLSQARTRCDRLVVAINADSSVSRLKGPTRPVNDETSRAYVLGGLACVDMVVIFGDSAEEDDKPVNILKHLSPDVLIKGGDYNVSTVVGADYVMSYGGEIWLAPIEEGKSTTATIQKMKDDAA